MLTVLLGGARSGKSAAALQLAVRQDRPVTFIATSPHIDGDHDLDARIETHRAERPEGWHTIEEQLDLGAAIAMADDDAFVIVDCLTVWLGNVLHHRHERDVATMSGNALEATAARSGDMVVITNEVGMGIVPADDATRRYRDLLGRVNQQWVAASDRAALIVAGRALELSRLTPDTGT